MAQRHERVFPQELYENSARESGELTTDRKTILQTEVTDLPSWIEIDSELMERVMAILRLPDDLYVQPLQILLMNHVIAQSYEPLLTRAKQLKEKKEFIGNVRNELDYVDFYLERFSAQHQRRQPLFIKHELMLKYLTDIVGDLSLPYCAVHLELNAHLPEYQELIAFLDSIKELVEWLRIRKITTVSA